MMCKNYTPIANIKTTFHFELFDFKVDPSSHGSGGFPPVLVISNNLKGYNSLMMRLSHL